MSKLSDRIKSDRTGPLATAVGMNLSVAGMLTMAASALGWVEGSAFWLCWLALAGFTTTVTMRRLCHVMAPLFWISNAPPATTLAARVATPPSAVPSNSANASRNARLRALGRIDAPTGVVQAHSKALMFKTQI